MRVNKECVLKGVVSFVIACALIFSGIAPSGECFTGEGFLLEAKAAEISVVNGYATAEVTGGSNDEYVKLQSTHDNHLFKGSNLGRYNFIRKTGYYVSDVSYSGVKIGSTSGTGDDNSLQANTLGTTKLSCTVYNASKEKMCTLTYDLTITTDDESDSSNYCATCAEIVKKQNESNEESTSGDDISGTDESEDGDGSASGVSEDDRVEAQWDDVTEDITRQLETLDVADSRQEISAVSVVKMPGSEIPRKLLSKVAGKNVTLGFDYENGMRAVISGSNATGCTVLDISSSDTSEISESQKDKMKNSGINLDNAKLIKVRSDNADFTKSIGMVIPYAGLEGRRVRMYYETATGYVEWMASAMTVRSIGEAGSPDRISYAYVQIPQVYVNMVVTVD